MPWSEFVMRDDWRQKSQGALAVYANDEYIVEVRPCIPECGVDFRLAIKRIDKRPIHRWGDFQRIKNEIAGPNRTAVEVYPPDSEVTDTANIYHLWVFPEDTKLRFTLVGPSHEV